MQDNITSLDPYHNEVDLDAHWMPYTANRAFKQSPKMVERGEGMQVFDAGGRPIIDAISGLWCCNLGHCHPRVVAAIQEQAATLDYSTAFQVGHPKAFRLAERLADMAPDDLSAVFFTNSGSESVDTALKIALAYFHAKGEPNRARLVGRVRGYHGAGFGGTSVGGIGPNRRTFGPLLPGVLHIADIYDHEHQAFSRGQPQWGAHLADDLERLFVTNQPESIAAVIVEPFGGSAGVLVPPLGYLERLREITARHGILLIFDEVITAFGRLGASFAAERFGVTPDIITTAKGITSGSVPMGAVIARDGIRQTILDATDAGIELFHGYTYSGHPLASAAALACLDAYEEESLFDRAAKMEGVLEDVVHSLKGLPYVRDIRNIGMAAAIELEGDPNAPTRRALSVFETAFEEGVLVRTTGDIIALAPPLIASESDIAAIGDAVRKGIQALS